MERQFPIQSGWNPIRRIRLAPLWIPWSIAEKAYLGYAKKFPQSAFQQSLEIIAKRCGFGRSEMDEFYPNWRKEANITE
jgi:hypothetical protein